VSLLQRDFLSSRLDVIHDDQNFNPNVDGGGGGDANDPRVLRRLAVEPMFYIHVPKCGSSFATALAHLACGDKIEEDMTVREPGNPPIGTETWNSKCGDGSFTRFDSGHVPLPKTMSDDELSKVVMMVRSPKSRMSSAYIHNLHDCGPLQRKYDMLENAPPKLALDGKIETDILAEYATCVHSCTVNMIIGHGCEYEKNKAIEVPSKEQQALDVQTALERLRKFGFVGLTDQWDLSICLWHAKFGGECLAAEFTNLHEARVQYDEGSFPESLHLNDQDLYDEAAELFAKELEKYDVTPKACATTFCPSVAHLFGGSSVQQQNGSSSLMMAYTRDSLKTLTWPGRGWYNED
jgi:hypothetical protein